MKQLGVVFKTDKILFAPQEVHDVHILEPQDDIVHNRVADENQHIHHGGQREEQADVVMPEESFDPVQNDSPFPCSMIAAPERGNKAKKLNKEEKSKVDWGLSAGPGRFSGIPRG